MRVLYVEDNPANVFLVKRVARMGKHEIINYIDGGQALKKFNDIKPDLILMDIQLAGDIGGLDVVRQLRARGVTTPIIAVTAYAMVGDKERCLEAGCDDYLAKPLPVQQLVQIFENYSARTTIDTIPSIDQATVVTTTETEDEKKVEVTDNSSKDDTRASASRIEASEEKSVEAAEAKIGDSASTDEIVEAAEAKIGDSASTDEIVEAAEAKISDSASTDEVVSSATQTELDVPEKLPKSSSSL
jgi:CheY-like chemotaxis protein